VSTTAVQVATTERKKKGGVVPTSLTGKTSGVTSRTSKFSPGKLSKNTLRAGKEFHAKEREGAARRSVRVSQSSTRSIIHEQYEAQLCNCWKRDRNKYSRERVTRGGWESPETAKVCKKEETTGGPGLGGIAQGDTT